MLLKITGSIIVLISSTLLGFVLSRDYSRRLKQIREIQILLHMLENEISYFSNVLEDAFDNICRVNKGETAQFFKGTVKNLQNDSSLNACSAWVLSVESNIKRTALNSEDKDVLNTFGKMLGNSDIEGQIKNIRLTLDKLKVQEQNAEEHRKKNEGMCKRLGLLGGIAIVILLF